MRFFIALEIPSQNLAEFQSIQRRLHTLIPQTKITSIDKVHLTLAFLGEQLDTLKDDLIQVIKEAVIGIPPFEVTPGYIDGFSTLHNPNILWVGVKGDIDKIILIREGIKDGLESLQLPVDERRFVPHITIAKLNGKFHINRELEIELEKTITENPLQPIKVTSIKLFESVPNEGFHKHNTLAKIKLG